MTRRCLCVRRSHHGRCHNLAHNIDRIPICEDCQLCKR